MDYSFSMNKIKYITINTNTVFHSRIQIQFSILESKFAFHFQIIRIKIKWNGHERGENKKGKGKHITTEKKVWESEGISHICDI